MGGTVHRLITTHLEAAFLRHCKEGLLKKYLGTD